MKDRRMKDYFSVTFIPHFHHLLVPWVAMLPHSRVISRALKPFVDIEDDFVLHKKLAPKDVKVTGTFTFKAKLQGEGRSFNPVFAFNGTYGASDIGEANITIKFEAKDVEHQMKFNSFDDLVAMFTTEKSAAQLTTFTAKGLFSDVNGYSIKGEVGMGEVGMVDFAGFIITWATLNEIVDGIIRSDREVQEKYPFTTGDEGEEGKTV